MPEFALKRRALPPHPQRKAKPVDRYRPLDLSGLAALVKHEDRNPANIMTAQSAVGNAALQRMLLQREVWDANTWIEQSTLTTLKIKKPRSEKLVAVDNALRAYDKVRDGQNLDEIASALQLVKNKLDSWIIDKTDDETREIRTARLEAYRTFSKQLIDEIGRVNTIRSKQKQQEILEARKNKAEKLAEQFLDITETRGIEDPKERAEHIFDKFTEWGRTIYVYNTTSKTDLLDGGTEAACGSYAQTLATLFNTFGITAKAVEVSTKNFFTVPLNTLKFIDPKCPGNSKTPTQDFQQFNRFFFSTHWVVESSVGKFDPTTGLKYDVEKAIDSGMKDFKQETAVSYKLSQLRVEVLQNAAYSGSGYLLTAED